MNVLKLRGVYRATKIYDGKLCKKCHKSIRYTSTGQCVNCMQTTSREAYRRNPNASIERSKERYFKDPEKHKNTCLVRLYGITLDDYNRILKKQDNVCAICKQLCSSKRDLCVDHDHKSDKVRGLLCVNCNRGIGNFRDSVELLSKAVEYLNEYRN